MSTWAAFRRSFWFTLSHFGEDFEDAAGFGWTVGERHVDWAKLIANKNTEISRLNGVYRKLLQDAGVTIMESRAEIVDPHTVVVNGKQITAKYILDRCRWLARGAGVPRIGICDYLQ